MKSLFYINKSDLTLRFSMKGRILTLFILAAGIARCNAGIPDSLAQGLACHYSAQQKVYLHTDREVYISGEEVLFKAYLVNAYGLNRDTACKVLYVALRNPANQVITRSRLYLSAGTCQGLLALPDTLSTGYYHISAFTNTMRNASHDLYFDQRILVGNLGDAAMEKRVSRIVPVADSPTVDFFPESGVLLEGVSTRVVFFISGPGSDPPYGRLEVLDDSLRLIAMAEADTAGSGEFELLPVAGRHYQARYEGQLFPVRPGPSGGYSLRAMVNADQGISLSVRSNASRVSSRTVRLVAVNKGSLIMDRQVPMTSGSVPVFLPGPYAGLVHFALLGPSGDLLCERTLFAGEDTETAFLQTDRKVYGTRQKARVTLLVPHTAAGDQMSLSAGVSRKITGPGSETGFPGVVRYLELLSGIGTADRTGIILSRNREYLDRFLVSRKFLAGRWAEICGKEPPVCTAPPENRGYIITGRVLDGQGVPLAATRVFLSVPDSVVNLRYAFTDREGSFRFRLDRSYDNRNLVLQVKAPGKCRIEPEDKYNEEPAHRVEILDMPSGLREEMQQARARALVSRVFQSSFISGMPDTSPIIFRPTGNFYGSPDETLHLSDYAELNDFNEIARNILPGVNYPGTGQKIRILDNASHVMQKEEALVFVNGIPFPDPAFVSKLDSRQVRKIDLKRHHLLYGNLDIAGILAISTREQDLYPLDPRMASLVYPNPVNDRIPKLSGPVYEGAGKWPENLPDFRQTLFWEPAVNLTDGKAELEFWTPDVRGTYTIRVEGITGNGQTVSATLDFKVN